MNKKAESESPTPPVRLPLWVCVVACVAAVLVSVCLWVAVSDKPMLESQWFMFAWPAVFGGLAVLFSLLNGFFNVSRVGWFFPSLSSRALGWASVACVVSTLALLVTGGSVHQILDMDLGRTPLAPLVFMLFLLAALGAIIGFCFTLMYLQPISTVLLSASGEGQYSRSHRFLSLPRSRTAAVSRGVLVMLVPVFAISVAFSLGPWRSDRYGFIAQSSEGIVRWLFSGDLAPISLIAWISLAGIIVCGIVAGLAFSRSEE